VVATDGQGCARLVMLDGAHDGSFIEVAERNQDVRRRFVRFADLGIVIGDGEEGHGWRP
jgi:hypothetical protein